MKKFLLYCLLFGISHLPLLAQAQTVYTPNLNLALPPAAPNTWGEQYNNNFSTLDEKFPGGQAAHGIQDEGANLTPRQKLNFKGAGVTAADNPGTGATDVTITSGGGGSGTPGGADGQVQFNSSGSFMGEPGFTYNAVTDVVTAGGFIGPLTGNVTGNVTGNLTGNASTATALSANPNNCSPGNAPTGITAAGVAEDCFDVATQPELDTHGALTGATAAHGAVSTNTASQIVTRDGSGNFAAGTITANLTGNVTGAVTGNASTATALAANGSNCPAGQAAGGVSAAGAAEDCIVVGSGAGVPIVLDLGNDASSESGDLAKITTTGDTNSIFTEPNADELRINVGNKWPASNTADALATNGANCSSGSAPLGVDAAGAVEGCFDVATQTELNTHGALTGTAAHGATTTNTASQIVTRDGSGNFAAGTITATLTGNVTGTVTGSLVGNASTATALAANGTNCSAGQAASGVDASGNAEGCSTILATPGGSDTQVQFNDGGTLGADAGLTYNKTTDVLTAVGGFVGALTGNATTATALAANPTDCTAGQFATAIAANGNLTCTTPAGGGDVTGAASSVNNEIALFSGTTGKVLQRATTTGILKGTSGVIGAAIAGADYVTPAGNVATATALAANGDNCAAGQAPLGVNEAGFVEGCTNYMEEPASTGFVAKTASNTAVGRAITTTTPVTVTAGDGVAANPVIACPTCGVTGSPLSQFAATTSAQLAATISNETGSGAVVFGTSPTLTTPVIGDFTTSQHAHTAAASGGKLTASTALTATGTPSSATFLRGDNAWTTVAAAAGGSTSQLQYNNAGAIAGTSGCSSDGTNVTCGTDNLRSTNSRITSGLRDTNGNPWIATTSTPSAVNAITVTNAATGGTPTITASGSDSNIGLGIAGQGTGAICIGTDCSSSTSTTGNLEVGTLKLNGTGSGTVSILPGAAAAGTYNLNLPVTAGTAGQVLTSQGGSSNAMTWTTLGAGTGTVTNNGGALTSNAIILGAGGNDSKVAAGFTTDGTSKVILGVAGTSVGSVDFKNATSGTITMQPVTGALGTVTLSLPATTGTVALEAGNVATATALAANPADCSSNQFAHTIAASGALTCSALTLASAQFANQGTTSTVLHGNAAGNPSFAAVSSADVNADLKRRSCELGWGSKQAGAVAIATDDDLPFVCSNLTGSTMTIESVECLADAANMTVDVLTTGGASILTGAVTCGNGTFVAATLSGTPTQANNGTFDVNIGTNASSAKYAVVRIKRTL